MRLKLILFTLKFVRILLTIITLSITAKYFGTDATRDNWLLAYSVFVIIDLAIWGPVNETFRAKFVELKHTKDERESVNGARSLLRFVSYSTIMLSILLYFFAPLITDLLTPNSDTEEKMQLVFMLQLIAPSLVINQFNLLLTSVLNAYNVFYIPEIAGIVSVFFNIIFILLFVNYIGIYSLFIGHYFSLIILMILILLQFKIKNISFFKQRYNFNFNDVKVYLVFALPFFIPYFFGQLSSITEKHLAGLINVGTISNLDYSRKFLDIPINVITSVMTTLYIPTVTRYFFSQQIENFRIEFDRILKFGFLLILIVSSFLILFSKELVDFLYNKGTISVENLVVIKKTLQLYSLSSLSIFLYSLSGFSLIASKNSKKYALYGVMTQILIMISNFILYKYLNIYTFPITLLIFHLISAIMMLLILKKSKVIVKYKNITQCIFLFFIVTVFLLKINEINYFNNQQIIHVLFLKSVVLSFILIPLVLFFIRQDLNFIKKIK